LGFVSVLLFTRASFAVSWIRFQPGSGRLKIVPTYAIEGRRAKAGNLFCHPTMCVLRKRLKNDSFSCLQERARQQRLKEQQDMIMKRMRIGEMTQKQNDEKLKQVDITSLDDTPDVESEAHVCKRETVGMFIG
jgi:hypothetical protein